MSEEKTETDDEFDARYVAYFNRKDIDGWEIRKAFQGRTLSIQSCREFHVIDVGFHYRIRFSPLEGCSVQAYLVQG